MGSDGIERIEEALGQTVRSGSCRFHAAVAGTPLDGEIDLEAGLARSRLGMSHIVPRPAPEQVHQGRTVYQHVDDGGERSWIAMPLGTGGSDPTGMLDLLRGAVSARLSADPVGPFDVEIDVEQASLRADDPKAFRAWADETGLPDRLMVSVRLDDEGRVRHVRSAIPAAGDVRGASTPIEVGYEGFGEPVHIVVPSQDQLA